MDDWEVFPREAAAVGMQAQAQGLARRPATYDELFANARRMIERARNMSRALLRGGFVKDPDKRPRPA
jgi:malate dehydrogenase (oxaloacetate-decarboxylating)